MKTSAVLLALWPLVAQALQSPLPAISGPRVFNMTLTWDAHAPDGFSRQMILMNGQFPGPLMEMNQGDQVVVNLDNQTPFNTTLHFHGIPQWLTPWSDGVPGVTQRNVESGQSFKYEWVATEAGTYWYHSHYKGQLDDGMVGPIYIHPRDEAQTPFSQISSDAAEVHAIEQAARYTQPLFLSDFRHRTAADTWELITQSGIDLPCASSLLINGKGQVDCWSADKMASLVTPAQKQFLQAGNITKLTAKGCFPASLYANVVSRGFKSDTSVIPNDIFDVCTPTQGSYAAINVTKSACETSKWLSLDVIGAFGLLTVAVSIDGLPMWVYTSDGLYVTPTQVDAITVANGDRFGVLVKLDKPGDYTVRVASVSDNQLLATHATISYRDAANPSAALASPAAPYISDNGEAASSSVTFFTPDMQKPFLPSPVPTDVAQTHILDMKMTGRAYNWALNNTIIPVTFDTTRAEPLLFSPEPHATDNYIITTMNDTWIDLIFITSTLPMPPHPIHKHGDRMYLIGQGTGAFPYKSTAEAMKAIPSSFNLVNPPLRDSWATLPAARDPTWMVVRYHVTNPGAWLMHCHITTHLSGGMAMVIQDGIDHWPTVPTAYTSFNA